MMKNLVIYHDDLDGTVGAYLLTRLRGLKEDETAYVPYNYGDELPTVKMVGSAPFVYFVDLQFAPEIWAAYDELTVDLTEIWDHHRGMPELQWSKVHHSELMSASKLIWSHLKSIEDPRTAVGLQRLVNCVDAFDMGHEGDMADFGGAVLEAMVMGIPRWQLPRARFAAITKCAENLRASIHGTLAVGQQIHKWKMGEVNRLTESFYVVEFDGRHMPVVNTQTLGKEMLDRMSIVKADVVAYWWYDAGLYEVRLRSTNGNIDVVEIAQRYGGGGHGRSAGFRLTKLPWTEVPSGLCEKEN
jgi:oligoribonuclease NrnB/cAMP/cGMP phosphodiesterase (DHH superfamily)